MKYVLSLLLMFISSSAFAQLVLSPTGTGLLVDSKTGKEYEIVERQGSESELYKEILKNVHTAFISPDDVLSTIENEMISIKGWTSTSLKYAGLNGKLDVMLSVKIDFKPNRMRISAQIVDFKWMNNQVDPYTFLVVGGLKVFNKQGEMKNEKRYNAINEVCQRFIDRIITPVEDDW